MESSCFSFHEGYFLRRTRVCDLLSTLYLNGQHGWLFPITRDLSSRRHKLNWFISVKTKRNGHLFSFQYLHNFPIYTIVESDDHTFLTWMRLQVLLTPILILHVRKDPFRTYYNLEVEFIKMSSVLFTIF